MLEIAGEEGEHAGVDVAGGGEVGFGDVVDMVDVLVVGGNVDEVEGEGASGGVGVGAEGLAGGVAVGLKGTGEGIAVGLEEEGLGADEVVGAGGEEEGTVVVGEVGPGGHRLHPVLVLVAGADEPGEGAGGEGGGFTEGREVVGGAVEEGAASGEVVGVDGHRPVLGGLGHVQREVSAGGVAREEHPVRGEAELVGMDSQVIQGGGAVGQLVGDVPLPVVEPILDQHDIIPLPEEDRREFAVVRPVPAHIEPAVNVDEHGILPHRRIGIIDVKHLRRIPVLDIGNPHPVLAGIGIEHLRRRLRKRPHHHLQHRLRDLNPAASSQEDQGCE